MRYSEDAARTAGRGGVAVLGAKVFFLVVGFVQQPLLRLAVGLSDFGGLAQALVVANTVNNVVVASGTQGVSRAVAAAPDGGAGALRTVLRVHGVAAFVVAAVMAAATPLYARFERAQDVTAPLLVLAAVALLYGLYAPLIGYLNGRSRFGRQAALDVTFATLRTLGLVGMGWAFVRHGLSGALGTTVGWVAAAACILPIAAAVVRRAAREATGGTQAIAARAYVSMLLPIAGAQLCTNLLMQVDIALLGRFLSESAMAREDVKSWVAIYKECQTFAFLPYQLLFSVTLVLFPMLARAQASGDYAALQALVSRGARLAAIFCGMLVGVVVAMPESLLAFAYGAADAARGAEALRAMALAQGAFAMLGIATTVLTSIGRERVSALLTLAAVGAVAAACFVLVPGAASGQDKLVRSAEATGGALVSTLVAAGALVRLHAGAFVPAATAVRAALGLAGCFALGFVMPHTGRLETPAVALLVAMAYFLWLVAARELTRADLAMLKTLAGRKR